MPTDPAVLVIVPTYDEAHTISAVIAGVRDALPDAHVLVVDDDSPDGTGGIAAAHATADDRVHVLRRSARLGLATAYLAGFRWGISRGFDVLVQIDADGSHPIDALPALVGAVTGSDPAALAIGSRWVPGGTVAGWPRSRRVISRLGNRYARTVLRLGIRDVTAGCRAYRADTVERMDLESVRSRGHCFQIEMTMRVHALGLRIQELPIAFSERVAGRSKMSAGIVLEALWRTSAWAVLSRRRDTARFRPRLPVASAASSGPLSSGGGHR